MSVNIDMSTARQRRSPRFMRKPSAAINQSVASHIESILYIPLARFCVVVPANEPLLARPFLHSRHKYVSFAYSYIAQMNQNIIRTHHSTNVGINTFRMVIRSLTIGLNIVVVQVSISN